MRNRTVEFKVGLLILTALAVVVGFILVLGSFALSAGYALHVDYDFVGNIQAGAPVKVSGIRVGKVEAVELWGGRIDRTVGRRVQVRVTLEIEDEVRETIRQDAEFYINTAGVLGAQYIEVVPGRDYHRPPLSPGAIVRGVDPARTDLIVSRLYNVLDSLSSVLHDERDRLRSLVVDAAGAARELNRLLADNRQAWGELVVAGGELARQGAGVLGKVNRGIGDPQIIGQTLRDADELLRSARTGVDRITPAAVAVLDDARRVTGIITEPRVDRALAVADRAVEAANKAGSLIDNVDGMVTDLRRGKGTAGALLSREELYADLREMIRDLKRNPWKFFWKE
jgi:phospholipid/cholesterol/gamma-HCH transport system substrate-binding protein